MKKVFSILGLCAFTVLAFNACNKADTPEVIRFTATISQPLNETKTHASGMDLVWDEDDVIKVVNPDEVSYDFKLVSATEKVATFVADDPNTLAFIADIHTKDYVAFYPNSVEVEDGFRMTIPAEQTYVSGRNFANNTYPMVGFNEGSDFVFQSNAGFLCVSFMAPAGQTREIDRVVLIANEDICGDIVYAKDGLSYIFEALGNTITLTSSEKLAISDESGRVFTFILPEGCLANGFRVEAYDGESLIASKETMNPQNVIVAQEFRDMPVVITD